jgi:hypothetical protein
LDRTEALSHPLIAKAFDVSDHIVTEDPVVKRYLDKTDTA